MVLPDDAGIGLTPASEVNSDSVRIRPWCDHAVKHLAALMASNPFSFQEWGGFADSDQSLDLVLVVGQLRI